MADQPFDRLPGESARAYAAFCAYRDLGPLRSIAKALAAAQRPASQRRYWEHWSAVHQWVRRAEAYDAHLERLARKERETEHLNELEAFRNRQRRLAVASLENSIELLKKAGARLKDLDPKKIPVKSLPQFFRAAAAVATAATDSEAQALAVAELLALLDEPARPAGGA